MDEQTNAATTEMTVMQTTATTAPAEAAVPAETFLGMDSYAWVGLAFFSFVLLLWKLGAFAMIAKALDGQAEKVRSDLAEAATLKAEAEAMKAKAVSDAAEAEAGAKAMLANAEIEAKRIVEQAGIDAEAAISRRTKIAEDRIAAEARATEAELRARAADITVKAAQMLLAERSGRGELAGLTDDAIAGLDRR
jgi:F-type H+-transporting ATPase subunit b